MKEKVFAVLKSVCCVKKIEILTHLHKTGLVLVFYPCQKAPPPLCVCVCVCVCVGGGGGQIVLNDVYRYDILW